MIRFRTERFAQRLAAMPLLKLLIPFAVGIALAEAWMMPVWLLLTLMLYTGVAALLTHRSIYLVILLVVVGWFNRSLRTEPLPLNEPLRGCYVVQLTTDGVVRNHRLRAEGRIEGRRETERGSWHSGIRQVMISADTQLLLRAGDRLLCEATLYPLRGAEGFRRLMARRGVGGLLYLSERGVIQHDTTSKASLHTWAARRLQSRLASSDTGRETAAEAVVRAMSVGDRNGLNQQLRTQYARSSMAHLLAVSGLHTGIVFAVINLLLWWLPLVRRGHIWRNLIALVVVWLYVAVAGFPPSAIRAAVMCSILQIGLAASSPYSAMNAWAAAAFGMLVWNPLWLGDVSFQLSFVAVAAILLWGVPLGRRCRVRVPLLNGAVRTLVIGLVASAATAPLAAYHFGIVPLVGLWLNPLVVLLGTVVVTFGLLSLLTPVGVEAAAYGACGAADLLNRLSAWIASMDAAVWQATPSGGAVGAIYLLLVVFTLAGWCIERKKEVYLSYVE